MDNAVMPEHESVEAFVQFCLDDELETFTADDLIALAITTRKHNSVLRTELEGYGLHLQPRARVKHTRGFTTSSNDRWFGPGSCPTHGGSGYEQINGFAGRSG